MTDKENWLDALPEGGRKEIETYFNNHNNYDIEDIDLDLLKKIAEDFKNGRKDTANFRLHAKLTADNYHGNGKWSSFEIPIREILESMGLEEDEDWYHNWKCHNEGMSGYFEVDFILPDYNLIIEADSALYHDYLDGVKEKDKRRDEWFKRLGFETLRINPDEMDWNKYIIKREITSKMHECSEKPVPYRKRKGTVKVKKSAG